MNRGLLIVDVQRDFCEGGALAVAGGAEVARQITKHVATSQGKYAHIFLSRDWHNPLPDTNGGHFAEPGTDPDYVTTWPVHCVAGSEGAQFHPALSVAPFGHGDVTEVRKGQGRPDYSAFQGTPVYEDESLTGLLQLRDIRHLDVVGIATDHCVYLSSVDALKVVGHGILHSVTVLTGLCAGVDAERSRKALRVLEDSGARIV